MMDANKSELDVMDSTGETGNENKNWKDLGKRGKYRKKNISDVIADNGRYESGELCG
jgi:hypothetical protein